MEEMIDSVFMNDMHVDPRDEKMSSSTKLNKSKKSKMTWKSLKSNIIDPTRNFTFDKKKADFRHSKTFH